MMLHIYNSPRSLNLETSHNSVERGSHACRFLVTLRIVPLTATAPYNSTCATWSRGVVQMLTAVRATLPDTSQRER